MKAAAQPEMCKMPRVLSNDSADCPLQGGAVCQQQVPPPGGRGGSCATWAVLCWVCGPRGCAAIPGDTPWVSPPRLGLVDRTGQSEKKEEVEEAMDLNSLISR